MRRALGYWALFVFAISCSGDDTSGGQPCVGGDERCGGACGASQPCPPGLYCSQAGECAKECDLEHACSGGANCRTDGRCQGGTGGPAGDGGQVGGGGRPGACADTVVRTTRTTPTVILIVDQSSSMEEDFDNGSRWDVLRDFLLEEPSGLIADLQSQVHFGLALYSAESGGDAPLPIGECPMVTTVAPAPDNFNAIAQAYRNAEPIEDTPTGDSIDKIVGDLGLTDPDAMSEPLIFVLATDGEPDRCEELDPQQGQAEAIAATERAHALGIRTFVISVGSEISEDHQQDMANAGLGRAPGDPDAEYWRAGDDQSLRDALTSIVGGQLGCDIQLNGEVQGDDPCVGKVKLNGIKLACGDADGWELVDSRHIRLLGQACADLKADDEVYLDVSFPCDGIIVD